VSLIHVEWFLKITTKRGDENLVYFVLHDQIGQPPALRALNAVSDHMMNVSEMEGANGECSPTGCPSKHA
jgi:hypothetical protein